MPEEEFDTLLSFFKVLGNESRLKIIGLLANTEHTVGELATALGVKEPTVSQHLAMLKHVGLVNVRPDGNLRYYSFNTQALINLNKEVFSRERFASLVKPFDEVGDEWERKVLQQCFKGEQLTHIPANDRKFRVVLDWLVERFEYGKQYPEKQVNETLKRHHEDYALLRRALVDYGYMAREKGVYWRLERTSAPDVE